MPPREARDRRRPRAGWWIVAGLVASSGLVEPSALRAGEEPARQESRLGRLFRGQSDRSKPAAIPRQPVKPAAGRSDSDIVRTQGPVPPPLPRGPGRGEAGPANPPLPPAVTMPSGPVFPPRPNSTSAPSGTDPDDVAASPTVPPSTEPTPPESEAGRPDGTLENFLDLAARHNPTLVQAESAINVSRGRAWQAALWPNPLLGYQGEHMGARHGEGNIGPYALGEHQAFFFQQEIPTANRRRISRRKFEWEAESARWFALWRSSIGC